MAIEDACEKPSRLARLRQRCRADDIVAPALLKMTAIGINICLRVGACAKHNTACTGIDQRLWVAQEGINAIIPPALREAARQDGRHTHWGLPPKQPASRSRVCMTVKSACCAPTAFMNRITFCVPNPKSEGGNPISALGARLRAMATMHCPMPAIVLGKAAQSGVMLTQANRLLGSAPGEKLYA